MLGDLDVQGDRINGTAIFGQAIPNDPEWNVADRVAMARNEKPQSDIMEKEYEPYAMDPAARSRYERFLAQQKAAQDAKEGRTSLGGKSWDAASWIGFVIIGPVITVGVTVFIFMTRGPMWGLGVFIGLVVLDFLLFFFG